MDKDFYNSNIENFDYLFSLRAGGRVNMFGAGPFLVSEMGLTRQQARTVLSFWMTNCEEIAKEMGIEL
jgi:hypothetical protein